MYFDLIVAVDKEHTIGIVKDGIHQLPWKPPKGDLINFNHVLTHRNYGYNAVIVGYNTWISLPNKYKVNNHLIYFVISKNIMKSTNLETYVENLSEALFRIRMLNKINRIVVIGGSSVYQQAMCHPNLGHIIVTHIDYTFLFNNRISRRIYFPLSPENLKSMISHDFLTELSSDEYFDDATKLSYRINVYRTDRYFYQYYSYLENMKYL